MILIRLLFLFFWRRIRIAVVVGVSDIFTILSISFYIECDAESMLFIQTEAVLFKAGPRGIQCTGFETRRGKDCRGDTFRN